MSGTASTDRGSENAREQSETFPDLARVGTVSEGIPAGHRSGRRYDDLPLASTDAGRGPIRVGRLQASFLSLNRRPVSRARGIACTSRCTCTEPSPAGAASEYRHSAAATGC